MWPFSKKAKQKPTPEREPKTWLDVFEERYSKGEGLIELASNDSARVRAEKLFLSIGLHPRGNMVNSVELFIQKYMTVDTEALKTQPEEDQ